MTPPLILITNDDGIASKGLRSAAEACDWSGRSVDLRADRSAIGHRPIDVLLTSEGRIFPQGVAINGRTIMGYAVEGTPAQVVQHGMFRQIAD